MSRFTKFLVTVIAILLAMYLYATSYGPIGGDSIVVAAWEQPTGRTKTTGAKIGSQYVHFPVEPVEVMTRFGVNMMPLYAGPHKGVDLRCIYNNRLTQIYAAADGVVSAVGDFGNTGPYAVRIDHGDGYLTEYFHNSVAFVKKGDNVLGGQPIATCGTLGLSTGPHLHFGVRINGKVVNPSPYLWRSS